MASVDWKMSTSIPGRHFRSTMCETRSGLFVAQRPNSRSMARTRRPDTDGVHDSTSGHLAPHGAPQGRFHCHDQPIHDRHEKARTATIADSQKPRDRYDARMDEEGMPSDLRRMSRLGCSGKASVWRFAALNSADPFRQFERNSDSRSGSCWYGDCVTSCIPSNVAFVVRTRCRGPSAGRRLVYQSGAAHALAC